MVTLALAFVSLYAQKPDDLKRVVTRIRAAYATCSSYRDRGTASTVFTESTGLVQKEQLNFETAFLRPGRLKFEFSAYDPELKRDVRYVLSTTGKREMHEFRPFDAHDPLSYKKLAWMAILYDTRDKRPELQILGTAVAAYTGISSGVAHTIPGILFPDDVSGLDYLAANDLRLAATDKVYGRPCDVLETRTSNAVLWFDKGTHLLVKLVQKEDLGTFENPRRQVTSVETVLYRPQINAAVRPEELVGRTGG